MSHKKLLLFIYFLQVKEEITMKKMILFICGCVFFMSCTFAEGNSVIEINSPSAILTDMSGNIIFEKNADEVREPASVTKIMTMLLAFEAIESGKISLDDIVTVSELASSQGGSQVYLEVGEKITVDELLKSIVVSSANDASVAIGEFIAGSNDVFVSMMNEKARELGMTNTVFKNANGLPEEGHLTSARDIAIMSSEVLKYEKVYDYTTIWMDTIRGGEFGLSNTNKLLKTYDGTVGLKTGYTGGALYCISASAIRSGEQFIAVVMGAPSSDLRNADAAEMLDYAFANFRTYYPEISETLPKIPVKNGKEDFVSVNILKTDGVLIDKNAEISYEVDISDSAIAPISKGDVLGKVTFFINNRDSLIVDIVAEENVDKDNFVNIIGKLIQNVFMFREG